MENLIEFDAEIFSPFERVFFGNQESSGKYPIIIRIYNLVQGWGQPVPDSEASWKGYGSHIVFDAFLEVMCSIDFVRDCFGILSGNWVKEK